MGERVTLTCEIESGDYWNYEWYKNNNLLSDAKRKEYEISNVGQYHAVKVRPTITSGYEGAVLTGNTVNLYCTLPQSAGWRFYWSKHTQSPEKKTITNIYTISSVRVSDGESNKAVVNIKPDKQVFKGEPVTLRCDIQAGGDTEWTYSWYKDDSLYPNRRTQEFTISSVTESNAGKYTCRGERTNDLQKSEISDAVTLSVSDVAQAVLSVSPQSWLTEGDSVTLSCEVTGSSTGWTFSWYRAVPYRQGLNQIRDAHGGDVILDSPVHPVTEGDSLTLRCLYRSTKPSDLTADFYRDGSLLQTQTTGEMIICTVSKSDEGPYHCKHPEKGESPKSWLSVRAAGSGSTGVTVGVAVGLSLTVFLIITLGLVYYCRKRTDDSTAQPSEVTYAEVVTKRKPKGNNEAVTRPDNVTYSQLMKDLNHHERGDYQGQKVQ
ncbi:hypothetical protein NFI96_009046 [Prochilodus magdalenae]|nr:hypothetical protein NFI96_009046 [Prochilodus magdalenae]